MLESLSTRTLAQKQYHLAILCELRKAKYFMENGESPAVVFESIDASSDLAVKFGITRASTSITLVNAAAQWMYGNTTKCTYLIQQILSHTPEKAPSIDISSAMAKLAIIASWNGEFKESLAILEQAKSNFPISFSVETSREWLASMGSILFDASFYQTEYELCKTILDRWMVIFEKDQLVMYTWKINQARLFSGIDKCNDATNILQTLIESSDPRSPYVYKMIEAQLLLFDIYMVSFFLYSLNTI